MTKEIKNCIYTEKEIKEYIEVNNNDYYSNISYNNIVDNINEIINDNDNIIWIYNNNRYFINPFIDSINDKMDDKNYYELSARWYSQSDWDNYFIYVENMEDNKTKDDIKEIEKHLKYIFKCYDIVATLKVDYEIKIKDDKWNIISSEIKTEIEEDVYIPLYWNENEKEIEKIIKDNLWNYKIIYLYN